MGFIRRQLTLVADVTAENNCHAEAPSEGKTAQLTKKPPINSSFFMK